jgi:hypothetical protein
LSYHLYTLSTLHRLSSFSSIRLHRREEKDERDERDEKDDDQRDTTRWSDRGLTGFVGKTAVRRQEAPLKFCYRLEKNVNLPEMQL